MTGLVYATIRAPLHWRSWPTLLSALLLGHFAFSAFYWIEWLGAALLIPNSPARFFLEFSRDCSCCAPAFVLALLAGNGFWRALQGHWGVWTALVATILPAIALFTLDIKFQRYQYSTFPAMTDWTGCAKAQFYFTWWWYND